MNILSERAGILYDEISDKIHCEEIYFCRHCAEHGRLCGLADITMEDKEKLIAIRDSLKDVQNMLKFYQTLESRQQRHYNGALVRLEASRMLLIDKLNKYPTWGKKQDIIEELKEYFGQGKIALFSENSAETEQQKQIKDEKVKKNRSSFLAICIKGLFNPWNWYRTTRIAAIAWIVNLYRNRMQNKNNKMLVPRLKIDYSDSQLAVSFGKG
ncbi:hypothetical protein RND71_026217 [Anisodus tanguticus]|uniref:Uncharacterized protein n=1 Tax=Anisodus tanguticus TaxID=243964 RepID=A0AAE1V2N9_9SOLA|nr:hypothetical protein RND71_026217 [Anisodus tanguticus]